jgi:L-malate glycosyltransferase
VHQFVPSLLPRDAVGNHMLATRRDLRRSGVPASIWASVVHPSLRRWAAPYEDYPDRHRGAPVILYELASKSGSVLEFLLGRPEPKVLSYHNLTPALFFSPYDEETAAWLRVAQGERRRLCEHARVAVAASEFNARDLRSEGVPDVRVIPPYLGASARARPDPRTLRRLRAERRGTDVLFVGRLTPNKGHAHLIRLLAVLRAAVDPGARLLLVGSPGPPAYVLALTRMIDRLAPGAVVLTGSVSEAELAAYYAHADVLVCLSEHEGFCLPLVEAMRARVPVVAYAAGAVAETLGGAGIVLETRDPSAVAEVVRRVAEDADLRRQVCDRQQGRARELEEFPRPARLLEAIRAAAEAA